MFARGWLLVLLLVPTLAAAQKRPFAEEDLGRLVSIGDPAPSPDGSRVLYTTSRTDYQAVRRASEIVVAALPSGRVEQSWSGGSPAWSPDGKQVAYLAPKDGELGIWIRDLGAKSDRFLVATPQTDAWLGRGSAKNFAWSPDGRSIAYVATTPAVEPASDVMAFSRIMFKTRTGFTDGRRTHVWLVPSAGGEARLLTPGDYDEHSVAWAPDSRRIAFVSDRSADPDNSFSNDLFVLDVGSGALTQLTRTASAEFLPTWSPDGRWIAYEGWVRTQNTKDSPAEDTKAYVIPAEGGAPERVAPAFDRRVSRLEWHPSSRYLYFAAADQGRNGVYRATIGQPNAEPAVIGEAQVQGYGVDGRGRYLAFVRSTTDRPAELFVRDLNSGRDRQLTDLHAELLAEVDFQDAESFWATSDDGVQVQGWVMKPAGMRPGATYPAILNIHGGPHGAFGFGFSDRVQRQAAAGYAAIYVNPRGSVGYGQAFSDGSLLNWGGGDYQDLMAALDQALAANPWIDSTRLGVTGGSYGGFMTNWVITQTDRFKAAVSSASVSNLISFYGTSLYTDLIEAEFRGMPWDNYPLLWQWSPLAHVEGVKTPTLFLHGEQDHDVPITQAEEMYVALRKQGVEATLVRYPGEGHGVRRPDHVLDYNRRMMEWFDRYLAPRTAATP
ncbi:MAG: prolyl oligopeptidase family serine peptidase [Gemmatimonadales bacterium]